MPACTSISDSPFFSRLAPLAVGLAAAAALAVALPPAAAHAAGAPTEGTDSLDEDDFGSSPFTDYAEFNEEADEEADTRFFQHGRFFGVSLGTGVQTLDGNRGVLWQGGFPTFEFKLHYWFDFNVALDLGFFVSPHNYQTDVLSRGSVDANLTYVGVNLKYYFDTKNLSAPISFANPYLLLGGGNFTKTESSFQQGKTESDFSLGLSAGGGMEFAITHRKLYLNLEGKVHFARFKDTFTTEYQKASPSLDDLSGRFYTFTTCLMFTW